MQSLKIPKEDIETSSNYRAEEDGRAARIQHTAWMGIGGGWVPLINNNRIHGAQQWLQVNFKDSPAFVTHVATQGRDGHDAWVTKYRLQYLDDSNELVYFQAEGADSDVTVKAFKFN